MSAPLLDRLAAAQLTPPGYEQVLDGIRRALGAHSRQTVAEDRRHLAALLDEAAREIRKAHGEVWEREPGALSRERALVDRTLREIREHNFALLRDGATGLWAMRLQERVLAMQNAEHAIAEERARADREEGR